MKRDLVNFEIKKKKKKKNFWNYLEIINKLNYLKLIHDLNENNCMIEM